MAGSDRGKNQAPASAKSVAALSNGLAARGAADTHGLGASAPDSRRVHDPNAEGPLSLRRQDGALIITIEREERRNSLSLSTLEAFGNVFRYHLAPDDRAVIVTGSGARAFCAGADLKERKDMSLDEVRAQLVRYRTDLTSLVD